MSSATPTNVSVDAGGDQGKGKGDDSVYYLLQFPIRRESTLGKFRETVRSGGDYLTRQNHVQGSFPPSAEQMQRLPALGDNYIVVKYFIGQSRHIREYELGAIRPLHAHDRELQQLPRVPLTDLAWHQLVKAMDGLVGELPDEVLRLGEDLPVCHWLKVSESIGGLRNPNFTGRPGGGWVA